MGGRQKTLLILLRIWESGSECRLCKINLVTISCFKLSLVHYCGCYFGHDPFPCLCYLAAGMGFGALGFTQRIWPEMLAGARASALWPQLVYRLRRRKNGNVHC